MEPDAVCSEPSEMLYKTCSLHSSAHTHTLVDKAYIAGSYWFSGIGCLAATIGFTLDDYQIRTPMEQLQQCMYVCDCSIN